MFKYHSKAQADYEYMSKAQVDCGYMSKAQVDCGYMLYAAPYNDLVVYFTNRYFSLMLATLL